MKIYRATIGRIVELVKAYCKAQDERATINKHLVQEDEIKRSFHIRRENTGNYYLMCNDVYIEAFSKQAKLDDIEKRLAAMVETSIECYRRENE